MFRVRAGDDGGQILILAAVSMTVLLGIAALSIDASYMYDKRNRLYAAADAAAKSAAIEVHRRPLVTLPELQTFANQQVALHGFTPGSPTSVTINRPPASGPFAGNVNYVEAIVSEPTATFFGIVMGIASMTPSARAVAGSGPSQNCIITLSSPTNSPESLSVGNSTLNMPGCSVAANGDVDTTNPNATINAQSIGITGACLGQSCPQTNQQTGVAPAVDPLSRLLPPTNPGGCIAVVNPTSPLSPGCYSSIRANSTLQFNPGIFYVTGPILISNNVNVSGSGVMIFLAGSSPVGPCTAAATAGCIDVGNRVTMNLTAPTSGPYTGVLFYQHRDNHLNATFDGNNGTYNLSGASYFPSANVSFRNGMNATNDCTLFVAWSLLINNGNGQFSNTCSAFGGSPIFTVTIAE